MSLTHTPRGYGFPESLGLQFWLMDGIERLAARPKRYMIRDSRSLWLAVLPSGRKAWRWRWQDRGKSVTSTLGFWPAMTAEAARARRDELDAVNRSGGDPRQMLRRQVFAKLTVREFGNRYLAEVAGKKRKHPETMKRCLERDIYPRLGARWLDQVTGREVQTLVFGKRDAGKPAAAAAMRNVIKQVWEYAQVCGLTEANPAQAAPVRFLLQRKARSRALSGEELSVFFAALNRTPLGQDVKIALELILLTMCRKGELLLARRTHVNLERAVWEIPPEANKIGQAQIVYLSRQAAERFRLLMTGDKRVTVVLPARNALHTPMGAAVLNRALARVETGCGIAHFTVHDLRRTAATQLTEMGWDAEVVEKALGHTIKGVRGIYNRAQFAGQRREMLQAWADYLDGLKAGPEWALRFGGGAVR